MSYIFYTDFPPIQNGGHASHSIAWSWCKAMRVHTALVMTRRFRRGIDPQKIQATLGMPVAFIPDLSLLGLRRFSESLRYLLDAAILSVWLLFHSETIRKSGADRIFFFNSNHYVSLISAWLFKAIIQLPVEIYLVDDLEASALLNQHPWRARVTRLVERWFLPCFDKIYVISEGYVEHLKAKYGVQAHWLPLVIRTDKPITYSAPPEAGQIRYIGFSGSVNELYREALGELNQAVVRLNATGTARYRIALCVASEQSGLRDIFPDFSVVELFVGLPNEKLVERLAANYANFLPYSFAPELETMVSTAFSCKTAEYFAAGRPMLVYGPRYGSVPRHFSEHDLPLVCTGRGQLEALIREVEQFDNAALIAQYNGLVTSYHSPAALRKCLGVDDRADAPMAAAPLTSTP
jgi:hypothetical protein